MWWKALWSVLPFSSWPPGCQHSACTLTFHLRLPLGSNDAKSTSCATTVSNSNPLGMQKQKWEDKERGVERESKKERGWQRRETGRLDILHPQQWAFTGSHPQGTGSQMAQLAGWQLPALLPVLASIVHLGLITSPPPSLALQIFKEHQHLPCALSVNYKQPECRFLADAFVNGLLVL